MRRIRLRAGIKHVLRGLSLLGLSLSSLCCFSGGSAADAQAIPTAALPSGSPNLPPANSEKLFLSKSNLEQFQNALVAPLAEWVKEGRFVAPVVRESGFAWDLSTEWRSSTAQNSTIFELDEQHGLRLKGAPGVELGFPFGDAASINAEQDKVRRAYKILWNVALAESAASDLLYSLELSWMSSQSLLRKATGMYYKQYFKDFSVMPATAVQLSSAGAELVGANSSQPPTKEDKILSRELLRFFSPPVVFGFSEIATRFYGQSEDKVWIFSPVTGRSRPVLQSNRSDALLGSVLNFDDLGVWSGKIQSVAARLIEEKVLLVPLSSSVVSEVASRKVARLAEAMTPEESASKPAEVKSTEEEILTVADTLQRRDGGATKVSWNYESARFPQAAAWLPTSFSLVPKRVWLIEMIPTDPYYLNGKEILIVDQESMLPVYKLVYDRDGSYKKTVIGGWNLASSADGKLRFPYAAFVVAVEHSSKVATAFSTLAVRTFLGKDTKKAAELRALMQIENYKGSETSGGAKSSAGVAGVVEPSSGY